MKRGTDWPEDMAVEVWEKDDITFSVLKHPNKLMGHYCGYCRFPKRPLKEVGYRGIATYVPVHGGITLAEEKDDGSIVYGFDCAHAGDDEDPKTKDMGWLKSEAEKMALGILVAARFEEDYLSHAEDSDERARVVQNYHEAMSEDGVDFNLHDNFGAMINVLFGRF